MKTSHHEEKVRLLTRKLGDLMAKRHPPYDSKVEWCAAGLSDSTIRQESARLDGVLPAEHQAALSVFDGLLVDCPIDAGDVRAGLPEGHILISQIQFMREWNE